jgi:dUTP pyrophosphatase
MGITLGKLIYNLLDSNFTLKVKLLDHHARPPVKADVGAAGYDLFASSNTVLTSGQRKLVSTGISVEVPRWYYLRVAPRSGLSLLGIDIGAGVIDSSYRGELKVLIINNGLRDYTIAKGNKIAQLILERCSDTSIEVVDELSETERGYGGFNSTGK